MPRSLRVLVVVAMLAATLGVVASPASAAVDTYAFTLSGQQETPLVPTLGLGAGTMTFDTVTRAISFTGAYTDLLANVTLAHIHDAPIGVAGPIVYDLVSNAHVTTGAPAGTITGSGTLPLASVDELERGELYVNIHTSAFPGGEIRGQLRRNGLTPLGGAMSGAQETPPNASSGTGALTIQFNPATRQMIFGGRFSGLGSVLIAGHLHLGAPGVPGGIVYDLVGNGNLVTGSTSGVIQGTGILPVANVGHLLAGGLYVNLHTTGFPAGEIRGQVNTFLTCTLFGDNGNNSITGSKTASDTICGLGGNDSLTGLGGDDVLVGSSGNDALLGGKGNDLMDGGVGTDLASFADSGVAGPVTCDLTLGTASNAVLGNDGVFQIENVKGGPGDDVLTGDDNNNSIEGGPGNDTIAGGDGGDVLRGQTGADSLSGEGGNDHLQPGLDDDPVVDGGTGSNTLGYGDVVLPAGPGQYLDLDTATSIGPAGTDSLTFGTFDNIVGTNANDTLYGNAGANLIIGRDGGDLILGFAGNDIIQPGLGDDPFADGGADVDTLSYADLNPFIAGGVSFGIDGGTTSADPGSGSGADTVANFENIQGSANGDTLAARVPGVASLVQGLGDDDTLLSDDGDALDTLDGGAGTNNCSDGGDGDTFVNCAP